LHLDEPFYLGLGGVSHDVTTTDKVEFSHVSLQSPAPQPSMLSLYSTLQTISINDQFRRAMVIQSVPGYVQSPNWAPDGKHIYVHAAGRIQSIPYLDPPAGGTPQVIETRQLVGCSGNFGLSPDGKLLAVSCAATKGARHDVYVLRADGSGEPRKVTSSTRSSYFHAWAPDSRAIAFTRGSAGKADIFTIALEGGTEIQLTKDTLNDGPDYSPDGKFIYFDSSHSGTTQIWRMKRDGSDAEQITDDANINSSPHVSPDGKTIAFLSQVPTDSSGEPAPDGSDIHPTSLKVMSGADGLIRTIASFAGSRGSFSMYGWGDGTHLAFVSYQRVPGPNQLLSPASGGGHAAGDGPASAAASVPTPSAVPTRSAARTGSTVRAGSAAAPLPRPAITGISHIAVYATDLDKTDRFYTHDLGGLKTPDPENPQGVRYYFAPTQFVEVMPVPTGPPTINRLDHVAFTTADVESLRKYLASLRVPVPKRVEQGSDGSRWFDVLDPEGNKIEFVEPIQKASELAVNAFSHHIIHVGFVVHDRGREDGFFRTVLGFRPYWFGGMKDDEPRWVSQQVPDGTDWLEYMLIGTPEGRGIPASMSRADLGVLDHFSLGVPDTRQAYTALWKEDRLAGQTNTPKIGRDAKWQLNLLDPDGTRAEVMEFHAIGEPCCSPFTASDPQE
jgi:Tol biopolymer transport system component/catechol 2,3-dioxygenase-like lactoylglutathione lyase family enzyme